MPFWEDQNHGLIVHFMKSVLCEFTLIAWGLRAFVTVSCVRGTFNLLLAVSTKHFLHTQFTDGACFFSPSLVRWDSKLMTFISGQSSSGCKKNKARDLQSRIFVSPTSS